MFFGVPAGRMPYLLLSEILLAVLDLSLLQMCPACSAFLTLIFVAPSTDNSVQKAEVSYWFYGEESRVGLDSLSSTEGNPAF
jgi:hypothetical protein